MHPRKRSSAKLTDCLLSLVALLQPFLPSATCTSSDGNGTDLACNGKPLVTVNVNTSIAGLAAAAADTLCCSVSARAGTLCVLTATHVS